MLYIIRWYTYSLLMVQNMLLKTYLSYSTWYTILGMHINASDPHSQLHRIQEFLSNPSLPHENYHVFTRINFRTPLHFCSRPSSHLLKIRYTIENDALHLRHAEKQWKTSMTFNDHKLACNANRDRMRRRCRAKKFLGKATSLKKLLSPAINLLLSVWYRYGPRKRSAWMRYVRKSCMYITY